MRIHVIADLEGATGVLHAAQLEPGTADHAGAVKLLTHDVAAVLEGAFEAGATEAVVYDMHGQGRNLDPMSLPANTSVVTAKPLPTQDYPMGLDTSVDALFFVGARALPGTQNAVLPGTCSGDWEGLELNEAPLGDIALMAAVAAPLGIPLALVTSDAAGVAETNEMFGGVVPTVAVKHVVGCGGVLCRSCADVAAELRRTAAAAVKKAPELPLLLFPDPVTVTVTDSRGETKTRTGPNALAAYLSLFDRRSGVERRKITPPAFRAMPLHRRQDHRA